MKNYTIQQDATIKDVLKKMDDVASKVIFVTFNKLLLGAVSDGDIRRAILNDIPLTESVEKIMNKNVTVVNKTTDKETIKKIFTSKRIEAIPIVNNRNEIVEIIFWNNFFSNKKLPKGSLNCPVVIMAGGRGTRLAPFTNILPKPLIPIGERSMLEVIMHEYKQYGVKDFYISVNHKAKIIKAYFEEVRINVKISYIEEDKPLGTAGALKFVQDKINVPFFVSNCDIIIKDNYADILKYHTEGNYDTTLVASMQHHKIPYGVCELSKDGKLERINEKPEYDFLVNTGMYILNPSVLQYIPENEFFHITHLIEKLQQEGKSIGVYPVSEKSWVDVGQWNEFSKSKVLL